MTVPFDTSIAEGKLLYIKIIPDKEVWKDPLHTLSQVEEVMVCCFPFTLPFRGVLKIGIETIIDLPYRSKDAGAFNTRRTEEWSDCFVGMPFPTMNVTIDNLYGLLSQWSNTLQDSLKSKVYFVSKRILYKCS